MKFLLFFVFVLLLSKPFFSQSNKSQTYYNVEVSSSNNDVVTSYDKVVLNAKQGYLGIEFYKNNEDKMPLVIWGFNIESVVVHNGETTYWGKRKEFKNLEFSISRVTYHSMTVFLSKTQHDIIRADGIGEFFK